MGRASRSLALVASVGVALVAAASVSAQGPPIVNETMHFADEVSVFVDVSPCNPSQAAEITSIDTGMIHLHGLRPRHRPRHRNRPQHRLVRLPPDGGDAGRHPQALFWFGSNGKIDLDRGEAFGKGEKTFTFSARLILTDGTRISVHQVAHVVFDATGVDKISFDKVTAHCG